MNYVLLSIAMVGAGFVAGSSARQATRAPSVIVSRPCIDPAFELSCDTPQLRLFLNAYVEGICYTYAWRPY